MAEAVQFRTPPGRLVGGSPTKAQVVKDDKTGLPKTRADGSTMMEVSFALAIPKTDPAFGPFFAELNAADRAAYPNYFAADGSLIPGAQLALKITDGDSVIPNRKGKRPCDRDGYPGHMVIWFTRTIPGEEVPPFKMHNGTSWVDMDASNIKLGDWVIVSGNTRSNGSDQSPGMYRNVDMVGFVAYGPAIVGGGRDADEALGAPPPSVPAGASATPTAPAAAMPTAAAPAPTPPAAPAPEQPVAPPYDAHLPPPPAPPAPPAPTGPVMSAKAAGATYESFIGAGWTHEQLAANGYLA